MISLCDEVDNYEEAIEFRELTAEWQKLKPYVVDEIKPSLVTMNDTAEDEFVPDDELLELFLSEMGSGGIHSYLTSYGHLLERTLEMARLKEKSITVELLELIKTKYFKGEMPQKLATIEGVGVDYLLVYNLLQKKKPRQGVVEILIFYSFIFLFFFLLTFLFLFISSFNLAFFNSI